MSDLDTLRQAIDQVDDEILQRLHRRAELVMQVGAIKRAKREPFYVPDRERRIVERLLGLGDGAFPKTAIRPVFAEIISACLSLEEPLKVAYLGPEATFTHMASRQRFGDSAKYVPSPSIPAVFSEVEKGLVDVAVVPIENSTEGLVNSTLDMFLESPLVISAEIMQSVHHCLLRAPEALEGFEDVQRVYSHAQAIGQCRRFLDSHLPGVTCVEVASTALAAKLAKDDPRTAAIASELAGQLYGLKNVKSRIEDDIQNATRFLVIGRREAAATGRDKTSILLSVVDQAGMLVRILQLFAQRGINLTRIESHPSRKKAWDYVFFIDMEGSKDDPQVAAVLLELAALCAQVKVLGSYASIAAPGTEGISA